MSTQNRCPLLNNASEIELPSRRSEAMPDVGIVGRKKIRQIKGF